MFGTVHSYGVAAKSRSIGLAIAWGIAILICNVRIDDISKDTGFGTSDH